jgi:hypothetical protein
MHLQRTIGNQAVQRLFKSGYVRAKLTLGHPSEVSEQEADRVADQVMGMSDSAAISAQGSDGHEGNLTNQWRPGWRLAKSAAGDDEEIVQPQPSMMRHTVQRQPEKEVKSSLSLFKDGGRLLSNADRNLFPPHVIPDCAGARFHTDGRTRKPALGIQAPALTAGRDLFVAQSAYRLGRTDGRRLLVPILTHAIQQGHSVSQVQRQPGADATCNGQGYDPKKMCCINGELVPQSPIEDLEECPDRKQLAGRPIEYDGCSVPWFLRIGEDKDNPAGGRDTAFSDTSIHGIRPQAFVPALPCDVHDKCYQTCNPDPVARELCDMKLIVDASRVCNNSTEDEQVKERCHKAVEKANYFLVRHSFGEGSFEERQRQYCHCCPLPAHKDKKRQMIANTENVRLVEEPKYWADDHFLIERLPKGTTVEVLDKGAGEPFNQTALEYQWWWVRAEGKKGWVMQVLLDDVTGSP